MVIGFGFITSRIKGDKCRVNSRCSVDSTGPIFDRNLGNGLFLVFLSIKSEYTAPKTVASVIIGVDKVFQSIIQDIISSSPSRFGVGGSPNFDTQVIIHHKVINGVTNLNPRVIESVRVFLRS
jgi:hypothetical protein